MSVWGKIAGRYLFSGKSGSVTGWISGISAAGMAVGSAALIIILSVYNGFDFTIRENLKQSDPDFLVRAVEGKTFDCDTESFGKVAELPGVTEASPVLEETVALRYRGRQAIAKVRGLDSAYECSVSTSLAGELGIRTAFMDSLELYYPSRKKDISLINPESSLRSISLRPGKVVSLEGNCVILPMAKARALLDYSSEVSAFEIRCDAGPGPSKETLSSILGPDFEVLDRIMQQPALYKMMSYEKAAIFMILMFVVLIVAFNIYASLSMLIIEKKQDRETLRSLGASPSLIRRVFRTEGWMISWIGAAAGLLIGIVVVLLQQRFGFISMPGNSMMAAYPVQLKFTDILLTVAGVGLIGALVTAIGIHNIDKYED